ncbi:MAG: FAD-dependent oxidoreductase [Dehalococcoidia bacterium]|nr:FAD-dependent oxidoreductase [Dehalococcoidia bacterium]
MDPEQNIVIIGGMACGPKTAARARRRSPGAHITIVEQGPTVSEGSCGLPYYVGGQIKSENALLIRTPQQFKEASNIDVLGWTRATSIDRKAHTVEVTDTATGETSSLPYDKLVLATGAVPVVPSSLEGRDLDGVFTLTKIADANRIIASLASSGSSRAVVVGGGLIGMEGAEAFSQRGLDVSVVEALEHVLPGLLDEDMSAIVEKELTDKGVHLFTGQRVIRLEGNGQGKVVRVVTEKSTIEADVVLLALGFRPNSQLARDAGLEIGALGGVVVDEFLQTSDPDIYAGGDCVENVHRVTGMKVFVPMGSTANKHGRIIGTNITGGQDTFPGVVGTAVAKVFDLSVGRVGISEDEARKAGFQPIVVSGKGLDRAGYYPGALQSTVKLVADAASGRVLGAQLVGVGDVSKRTDVLVTAISAERTVDDMANLDLAYAPPFSPAMDLLHDLANVIRGKMESAQEGH